MSQKEIDNYLKSIGFGFPASSEEIELFQLHYGKYDFQSDVTQVDPKTILESIRNTPKEVTRIDYHKRTVLAAEIVFQLHKEWSLGHVKLQKLLFLCQNSLNMAIHAKFLKQAMGPYDPRLQRSLDSQFRKNQWFEFRRESKQKYWPLPKAGGHKEWYEKYYHKQLDQIQSLIETFRSVKTAKVELVATIYACWQELLKEKILVNEQSIISAVYAWSPEKKKFTEGEISRAIQWMKREGIFPIT